MASLDPPLLPPGLHEMSACDLKKMVVDQFPSSKRRAMLWDNLMNIVAAPLEALEVRSKVWLCGSFVSEKIDPSDVDFVVVVPIDILQGSSAAQRALLQGLINKDIFDSEGFGGFLPKPLDEALFNRYQLHGFLMFEAPLGHRHYAPHKRQRDSCVECFGFNTWGATPKGIAELEIGARPAE